MKEMFIDCDLVSIWIEINAAFSFPCFPLFFFFFCSLQVNSNLTWVTVYVLFITVYALFMY